MLKKIAAAFTLFYVLALLEASFLAHFGIFRLFPAVPAAVFLINAFERPNSAFGLYSAAAGGLFYDFFSDGHIGRFFLLFLAAAVFIKLFLKKYVQIPKIRAF